MSACPDLPPLEQRARALHQRLAAGLSVKEIPAALEDCADVIERLTDAWRAARVAADGRAAFTVGDLRTEIDSALKRRGL